MYPWIEPVLYTDIQSIKPGCFCPRCGGACYSPGFHCLRCERRGV